MKTIPQVLIEQYPDFPFHEYGVVWWDGENYHYYPEAWPEDWPEPAPTLEQINQWIAES